MKNAAVWALLVFGPILPTQAQELKLSSHLESVKFSGDFRLRQENFKKMTPNKYDRNRERFRLRLGVEVQFPNQVLSVFRFASGTGEQVSTNQTFTGIGSQKGIYIDQAYLAWRPSLGENGSAYLQSGRMQNALWQTYSSDALWDADLNPEGVGEGIEYLFPDTGVSLFANAQQMAAAESANNTARPFCLSQQLGFETRLPVKSRLRMAAAYHHWTNVDAFAFGQGVTQDGNRRYSTNVPKNLFGVGEVTAELRSWVGRLPLSVQGTYLNNLRARDNLGSAENYGYQTGFILGKASGAKTWEAAYFYKFLRTDATIADAVDSDFGNGGTNRKGHILWLAYSPKDWLQVKAKYFITRLLADNQGQTDDAINRAQLDFQVKF
ncbi:MAG: putative porin [Elusimicrobiota bacterium]|jgi:hypothetical protein